MKNPENSKGNLGDPRKYQRISVKPLGIHRNPLESLGLRRDPRESCRTTQESYRAPKGFVGDPKNP
eukprot:4049466-Pyramimonas_sp.AAC.1